MTLKEKFLKKAFCMCEDESQIDNFIDLADDFAIRFAEWIFNQNPISLTKKSGLDNSYMRKSAKELLEIYKEEQYGK